MVPSGIYQQGGGGVNAVEHGAGVAKRLWDTPQRVLRSGIVALEIIDKLCVVLLGKACEGLSGGERW